VVTATFNASGNVGGANLTLSPTSGPAGSTVALNGTGFGASEQVNLTVDSGTVMSVTSDASGNFSTSLTLSSSLASGNHTIGATGVSSGHSAFVSFFVTNPRQPVACAGEDDSRPGNGNGDENHCHSGPPGHRDRGDDNGGRGRSNHGERGDGNDQGQDD
jgi:hypothetical protein